MLDVKEPETRRGSTNTRRSGAAVLDGRPAARSYKASTVTARPTTLGAGAQRRPNREVRPAHLSLSTIPARKAAPVPVSTRPVRVGRKDRLAQQEARLLAWLVVCASVICGLLVIYLAAYARVSTLGLEISKARVELRNERLQGETLRAQTARASSPERIAAAAVKNGMVLQHAQRICYVDPSNVLTSSNLSVAQTSAANPAAGIDGPKVASSGTSTGNITTSITN